jgi:suppressor for copper-sensitivity B
MLEAGPRVTVLAGGLLAVLLALLAWRHALVPPHPARRVAGAAALMLAAAAVLVPALQGQAESIEAQVTSQTAGPWRPFDEAALHRMVAERNVVFVDVTAAWCLTCKVNELTVLDRAPVADQLRAPSVIAMRADWTRPDAAITAYLQSFGRYGVPFNVVYGPGASTGIALPELLTQATVMDALRKAGASHNQEAEE